MNESTRTIQIIINPAAGNNEPVLNTVNDVFSQNDGIQWDVKVTHGPGDATEMAHQAAAAGCDLIAVYGGDGTLMEVINGLMTHGHQTPVAILPGGTGNTVAADLGIPHKLADALHVVATSQARRQLDIGEVNGHYFLLRAYTGIGSDYNASRELKDRLGVLAYPIKGLQFLKAHPPATFRIMVDTEKIEEPGVLCYVNNIAYSRAPQLQDWLERLFLDVQVHNGDESSSAQEPVLQTIDPTDGLLDVVLLTQNPFNIHSIKSFVVHSGEEQATVHFIQGKRIHIDADPPQTLWIDGEECGTTPAYLQAVPRAITVVVPDDQG